jgi:hypothetical protein
MGHIRITDEFAAALGKSKTEIAKMDLRELVNCAYDKGLRLSVSSRNADDGEGHLLCTTDPLPAPPTKD